MPALRDSFLNASDSAFKLRLADVLGRVGAKLSPADQAAIQVCLGMSLSGRRSQKVYVAILDALDQMTPGAAAAEIAVQLAIAKRKS